MKQFMKFVLALVFSIMLFSNSTALAVAEQTSNEPTLQELFRTGKPKELNGRDAKISSYSGKPVVLVFWEKWCSSCVEEVPSLSRLQEKYRKQGVKVIGISVDTKAKAAKAFAKEKKLNYSLLVGSRSMTRTGKVAFLPTLLLFDSEGKLSKRLLGRQTEEVLQKAVVELIQS